MACRIIGNRNTREFHDGNCFCLRMAYQEHLIPFASVQEALQEGYNGCGHCMKQYDGASWTIYTVPKSPAISESMIEQENLTVGFSTTEHHEPWDVVIIGAGPIGLSAAKIALNLKEKYRHEMSVLVLEKAEHCGADRRAETVNSNHTMDRLWGDGFLHSLEIARHQKNVFYAPYAKFTRTVRMIEAPYSFHWRGENGHSGLIDSMEERLGIHYGHTGPPPDFLPDGWKKERVHQLSRNAYLFTGVEVQAAGINSEWPTSTPVKYVETSRGRIYGTTVLDCSGYTTRIGRQLQEHSLLGLLERNFEFLNVKGEPYDLITNPIVKSNWRRHYPSDQYPEFQTFFIPRDAVPAIPGSPPGILVVFPSGNGDVEINFQVFDELSGSMPVQWEDQVAQVKQMWNYLKSGYPVFSDIIGHFQPEDLVYEQVTGMPSVGMIAPAMIVPGVALVGDAAGHVNPQSSSGLETGMLAAEFWVHAAWEISTNKMLWTETLKRNYNHAFMNTYKSHDEGYEKSYYQDLVQKHQSVNRNKFLIFGLLNWGGDESRDYLLEWALTVFGYSHKEKEEAMAVSLTEYQTYDLYQQSAVINAILSGVFVLNLAENTLLDFLRITKKQYPGEWDEFLAYLDMQGLFDKIQGVQLSQLFDIIGPLAAVEYAIYKHSKWIAVR
ncbi:MAG TPA: hypothetical protein VKA68_18655, partial [bacterium]|nr:hypothetical protein [bacterium]